MVWMDRNGATLGLITHRVPKVWPASLTLFALLPWNLYSFPCPRCPGAVQASLLDFWVNIKWNRAEKIRGWPWTDGTVHQQTYQGAARGESWLKSFIGAGWGAWEWGNRCSHRGLLCVSISWNCLPKRRRASLGDSFLYWCRRLSRVIDNFIGILSYNWGIRQPPTNFIWQLLNRKCQLLSR